MNRRDFLRGTAVTTAGMWGAASFAQAPGAASKGASIPSGDGEEPLFRMVQLNDIHLRSVARLDGQDLDAQDHYNTVAKNAAVMRDILEERHDPRPDLIVAVGDIADDPDDICHHMAAEYLGKFARVGIPVLPLAGNHEIVLRDSPDGADSYVRYFGGDLVDYAFHFRGVLFIMLFNGWGDPPPGEDMGRRAAWLERTCERFPDTPKIVCAHIPFVPMRDPAALKPSFGFSSWIDLDDKQRVQQVLARHKDSIIAVLHGHLHLTSVVEMDGLTYICPSGVLSWPNHYACFDFYADRVRVRMRTGDWSLGKQSFPGMALGNGIHERHEREFTDARHATMRDYIMGNPDEWDVTLPLEGPRRITPEATVVARKANGWPAPETRTVALPDGGVRISQFGAEPRVALVPLEAPDDGPFHVVSGDGRTVYLNALYEKTWTPAELRQGVPVSVPAGGSETLRLVRETPPTDAARVSTAQLRATEYRLALHNPWTDIFAKEPVRET